MGDKLLSINDLTISFTLGGERAKAVDSISFAVNHGQTVGVVGESGCGKTVTSLAIMDLIEPPGKVENGEVLFHGQNLRSLSEKEMRKIRGKKIGMIFQEPMSSLNPVFTIGNQISESFRIHQGLSKKDALTESIKMLKLVGIPAAEKRIHDYPHLLSGGMRQRVMIAMALACQPDLLIADEPTTALDVTIQAQILDLMSELQEKRHMSILLITHDLGVVAEACDWVVVMYAGRIVEKGSVKDIFSNPSHPYTQALLESIPRLGKKAKKLNVIKGNVPNLFDFSPVGCRFASRCSKAEERCRRESPDSYLIGNNHVVSCFLSEKKLTGGTIHE